MYDYFTIYFSDKKFLFQKILYMIKQNFSIQSYLVGEMLHSEFNVYRAILTGESDLKLLRMMYNVCYKGSHLIHMEVVLSSLNYFKLV